MNVQELLFLKFKKRFSTQQLLARFPRQRRRIAEVALLDVEGRMLRKMKNEKKLWERILSLKKEYRRFQKNMTCPEKVLVWNAKACRAGE